MTGRKNCKWREGRTNRKARVSSPRVSVTKVVSALGRVCMRIVGRWHTGNTPTATLSWNFLTNRAGVCTAIDVNQGRRYNLIRRDATMASSIGVQPLPPLWIEDRSIYRGNWIFPPPGVPSFVILEREFDDGRNNTRLIMRSYCFLEYYFPLMRCEESARLGNRPRV